MPCSLKFRQLPQLAELVANPAEWWVWMEGDWGGQIYLSIPAVQVKASPETLKLICAHLDKIAWDCNGGEGTRIYLTRELCGSGLWGGMGGGAIRPHLWLHSEFGFDPAIKVGIEAWLTTGERPEDLPEPRRRPDSYAMYEDVPEDWHGCRKSDHKDECGCSLVRAETPEPVCTEESCFMYDKCDGYYGFRDKNLCDDAREVLEGRS